MKIHTGDTVTILSGKDRGKQGKVLHAYPKTLQVLIEKLNMVKRHIKPTSSAPHGGIKEVERPLPAAKTMLVCPHCGKPTRVGYSLSQTGKSVRICRKCKEMIDVKS